MTAVMAFALLAQLPTPVPGDAIGRARYARCPGAAEVLAKAVNLSWEPRQSVLGQHMALRQRRGVPLPQGTSRILYHSLHRHHGSVEFSIVATRDPAGRWHSDATGETGPGLLALLVEAMPPTRRDLDAADSHQLDRLLTASCLRAAPTFQRDPQYVGGNTTQTLEIETAKNRIVLSWMYMQTPEEKAITDLITPR